MCWKIIWQCGNTVEHLLGNIGHFWLSLGVATQDLFPPWITR
jgi:hypothetical protein